MFPGHTFYTLLGATLSCLVTLVWIEKHFHVKEVTETCCLLESHAEHPSC